MILKQLNKLLNTRKSDTITFLLKKVLYLTVMVIKFVTPLCPSMIFKKKNQVISVRVLSYTTTYRHGHR